MGLRKEKDSDIFIDNDYCGVWLSPSNTIQISIEILCSDLITCHVGAFRIAIAMIAIVAKISN